MKKKLLKEISCPSAGSEAVAFHRENTDLKWIVRTQTAPYEGKKVLVLNFFRTSGIAAETRPAYRTFCSDSEYITENAEGKWMTSCFDNLRGLEAADIQYENGNWRRILVMRCLSGEDRRNMLGWFGDPEEGETEIDAFRAWQKKILDGKLQAKLQTEIDAIDAKMVLVPELPEGFEEWVNKEVLEPAQFLYFRPEKGNRAWVHCTVCGKEGEVDRKIAKIKERTRTKCPFCGAQVHDAFIGHAPEKFWYRRYVTVIQRAGDSLLWRFFLVQRSVPKSSMKPDTKIRECVREFISLDDAEHKGGDGYQWGMFHNRSGNYRWCHGQEKWPCYSSIMYPGNLPEVLPGTPLEHSGLYEIATAMQQTSTRYYDIYRWIHDFPKIEWIAKEKMDGIFTWLCSVPSQWSTYLNKYGRNIFEVLRLNKQDTRLLQQVHGGWEELRSLQIAERYGERFTPEDLIRFTHTFGVCETAINPANRAKSIHKLLGYVWKESARREKTKGRWHERDVTKAEEKAIDMATDWCAYVRWCKDLKMNLKDEGISMPTNFEKVHDRTYEEYQAKRDMIEQRKRREHEMYLNAQMKEVLRKTQGLAALSMHANGLIVVVPARAADLDNEGKTLHHCVATYKERVASGETHIFFIRKETEPDKPYYTLEYRDGKFIQCRGMRNCEMTPEVETFSHAVCRKLHEEELHHDNRKCG